MCLGILARGEATLVRGGVHQGRSHAAVGCQLVTQSFYDLYHRSWLTAISPVVSKLGLTVTGCSLLWLQIVTGVVNMYILISCPFDQIKIYPN